MTDRTQVGRGAGRRTPPAYVLSVRAVVFDRPAGPLEVRELPDPVAPADGAVVRVEATGVCRSDWHGWRGHDPDIMLPHVPGHEFAGTAVEVGRDVRGWAPGARVTTPFVNACGVCASCRAGDGQVCPDQTQPGFTRAGSFAEYVVVDRADTNLVALPEGLSAVAAASLGCRFATAYRAVVAHGRPRPGDWVVVHGCGGVGLAAVMVARSRGARVVAVDVDPRALAAAAGFGAEATLTPPTADAVRELTGGGAHVSLDAIGHAATVADAIAGLRTRGRHVQVGLLAADDAWPRVDLGRVLAAELEVLGSHGMAAVDYPAMLADVTSGRLDPSRLVARTVGLDDAPAALAGLGDADRPAGVTVVVP